MKCLKHLAAAHVTTFEAYVTEELNAWKTMIIVKQPLILFKSDVLYKFLNKKLFRCSGEEEIF